MPTFPAATLEHLAHKVLEGDVVFFIGAGFSLDSEGNSGARQVIRLLIRLLAFVRALDDTAHEEIAASTLRRFLETFSLAGKGPEPFPFLKSDVRRLTERYFEANDWFCSGFGHLLELGQKNVPQELLQLCRRVSEYEENIRTQGRIQDDEPGVDEKGQIKQPSDQLPPLDTVGLLPITKSMFDLATPGDGGPLRAAGKALFLDTMGFRDTEIMGGNPSAPNMEEVASSYVRRLLPRHQVIARLAREGVCTTTITTNFDLLLEGAFRLAGFTESTGKPPTLKLPHTTYNQYAKVASPDTFFTEGKAHRTSVLVKMHGCAERYRQVCATGDAAKLRAFLRTMVFTYREIQN